MEYNQIISVPFVVDGDKVTDFLSHHRHGLVGALKRAELHQIKKEGEIKYDCK